MKVLDPQSALLTNFEVYQFLRGNTQRAPDSVQGAYPRVNLTGLRAIRKDFNTYAEDITPHVTKNANVATWVDDLVGKLKPYDLTKTEVMNLINMGVGVRVSTQPNQSNGNETTEAPDEDAELARDVQFFKVAVEEVDERFPEQADERIREVITILKDGIKMENDK